MSRPGHDRRPQAGGLKPAHAGSWCRPRTSVSRGTLSKEQLRPQTLMGEVTRPAHHRIMPAKRLRNFATVNRLRPTIWAKDAPGVSSLARYWAYLTDPVARHSRPTWRRNWPRRQGIRVEDMFKVKGSDAAICYAPLHHAASSLWLRAIEPGPAATRYRKMKQEHHCQVTVIGQREEALLGWHGP